MTVHFQREIEKLKNKLLHLCAVVEEALADAVHSLATSDVALAERIIEGDVKVDLLEVEVEEDCLKLHALHQPVAVDLRFLVTAMKINNDLERVGDLAVNIAERTMALSRGPRVNAPADFEGMAEVTQSMLRRSVDALVNLDANLAREVCATDDQVDECNRRMFQRVEAAVREHPGETATWLNLLSVSRYLERIADHATNIAEDVIYMVEGTIARHRSTV